MNQRVEHGRRAYFAGVATRLTPRSRALVLVAGLCGCAGRGGEVAAAQPAPSPYAMQAPSSVPGLSAQEVEQLLKGQGMGLARAAELNGYPGPRHVLDLGAELELQENQRASAQAIFEDMQAEAVALGARIIELERGLGQSFVERNATADDMREQVAAIAELQGQLRAVHLEAHLALTPQLSSTQIAEYARLRGYAQPPAAEGGAHGQHHPAPN
jgi:hypothetical protein